MYLCSNYGTEQKSSDGVEMDEKILHKNDLCDFYHPHLKINRNHLQDAG